MGSIWKKQHGTTKKFVKKSGSLVPKKRISCLRQNWKQKIFSDNAHKDRRSEALACCLFCQRKRTGCANVRFVQRVEVRFRKGYFEAAALPSCRNKIEYCRHISWGPQFFRKIVTNFSLCAVHPCCLQIYSIPLFTKMF